MKLFQILVLYVLVFLICINTKNKLKFSNLKVLNSKFRFRTKLMNTLNDLTLTLHITLKSIIK